MLVPLDRIWCSHRVAPLLPYNTPARGRTSLPCLRKLHHCILGSIPTVSEVFVTVSDSRDTPEKQKRSGTEGIGGHRCALPELSCGVTSGHVIRMRFSGTVAFSGSDGRVNICVPWIRVVLAGLCRPKRLLLDHTPLRDGGDASFVH